jgi:hypothetical protein
MCSPGQFNRCSRLRLWFVSFLPLLTFYEYISGYLYSHPVAENVTSNFPTFQITIDNTQPIWGYCGQTGHCEAGMVFGFNTPSQGNTFAAFQQLAMKDNSTSTSTSAYSSQTSSYSSTTTYSAQTSSYSAPPMDHQIVVGPNGQLLYDPANITANPGDTVTFSFRQKNHTGTLS